MNQTETEHGRPQRQNGSRPTAKEQKGTLYVFDQIGPADKNKTNPQTKQLQVYNGGAKTANLPAAKPKNNPPETQQAPCTYITRLKKKFKKNGLGAVDSSFNAYFFYYIWRSEKKGRKKKGYLKTISKHPRGWGKYREGGDIYEKNEYDKYIAALEFIAVVYGFIAALFAPLTNGAKDAARFFGSFNSASKTAENIRCIIKKAGGILVPAAAAAFAVALMINISAYTPTLELTFEGQNLGFVDSKATVGKVVSIIENGISAVLEENYEFPGRFDYRIVLSKNSTYVSEKELYEVLYHSSNAQSAVTSAYGLYIDGELIIAAECEEDIQKVLDEVLEANTSTEDGATVEFAHDIQIIQNNFASRDVVTQEELKTIVSYSTDTEENDMLGVLYLSEFNGEGDEFEIPDSFVPLSNGVGLYNPDAPAVGGEDIGALATVSLLNLTSETVSGAIPRGFINSASGEDGSQSPIFEKITTLSASITPNLIQFKKIKTESYSKEVPFEIKYVNSEQYYKGTQTIQTRGKPGESMVTAEVTYIGETEIGREIVETRLLRDPVTQVVLVGTKAKPATGPTGNFIRPLRGGMSSRFTSGHRAIDIPAPFGTPVGAADGGTVIYAGMSGSYGNHVKIRHSDGFVTLYAHFSSISVKSGDTVFQGQEIGKVGSTGRSTGNHLHFEIIRNGVQVNPESYIR